jgi:hypothetical protein
MSGSSMPSGCAAAHLRMSGLSAAPTCSTDDGASHPLAREQYLNSQPRFWIPVVPLILTVMPLDQILKILLGLVF